MAHHDDPYLMLPMLDDPEAEKQDDEETDLELDFDNPDPVELLNHQAWERINNG